MTRAVSLHALQAWLLGDSCMWRKSGNPALLCCAFSMMQPAWCCRHKPGCYAGRLNKC